MLNKEHHLLVPFLNLPWRKYTFKEIKKISKKSSESYTYNTLQKFVKEKILSTEKAGNVTLYFLHLSSPKTQAYAGFLAEHLAWNKSNLPFKNIQKITSKIPTYFYILFITGSYVKNTQKITSDLDLVLIIDDTQDEKKIYAQIRFDCEMSLPPIHLYVFKKSEFIEMLLNNQPNYGKEIVKNNLILHGAEVYYNILQEVIGHGFNDKNLS